MKGDTAKKEAINCQDEAPPWFPEEDWDDDVRMRAMMEPFRPRDHIPEAYDGKMNFWFGVIRDYCLETGNIVISASHLRSAFVRKGRYPTCLVDVVKEMVLHETLKATNGNKLVPLEWYPGATWEPIGEGWVRWGLRKAIATPSVAAIGYLAWWARSGLAKSFDDATQFVHPEAIQCAADKLAATQASLVFDGECEPTLSMECFLRLHRGKFRDDDVLDKILGELQRGGGVRLGISGTEKILKFGPKVVAPLTPGDVAVAKLRQLEFALRKRIDVIETEVHDVREEAKKLVVEGKRDLAKRRLRRKQVLERKLNAESNALDNITELLEQTRIAGTNVELANAYGTGIKTLRSMFAAAGLKSGSEDAFKLMDELREQLEDAAEVTEAIAGSAVPASSRVEQAELEAELEELLQQEEEEKAKEPATPRKTEKPAETSEELLDLPSVPDSSPTSAGADLEDLASRLARIRALDA